VRDGFEQTAARFLVAQFGYHNKSATSPRV
jgi:hypothetical protein